MTEPRTDQPMESYEADARAAGESQAAESAPRSAPDTLDAETPIVVFRDGQERIAREERADTISLHRTIRERAYELYLARGEAAGDADSDWFAAEREVVDRLNDAQRGDSTDRA